jgi:hypothetical protein
VQNTPPTLPSQLLDLTIYGSSLIGPPRPIVTINFSDDFLWANDKSEIFLQYADYMHESLVESCVVSPKLNPKTDARYICLCIFFDNFIPLNLEDFDANVFPSTFDFFDDSSHRVVVTFDSTD